MNPATGGDHSLRNQTGIIPNVLHLDILITKAAADVKGIQRFIVCPRC
jgi:hypothetical protein